MARIRQLKPSFFLDEDVAELTPWARLLFQGLWTLADREGRLEERLGPIRVQVFPYDNLEAVGMSVASMLEELSRPRKHSAGAFITRYTVGDNRYIQIHGFTKHQKCHPNETPSELPACQQVIPPSTIGRSASTNGISAQPESTYTSESESNTESKERIAPDGAPAEIVLSEKAWATEAGEMWATFRGTPNFGRIGKALSPWVKRHTWAVVRPLWEMALEDAVTWNDPTKFTPEHFAGSFKAWLSRSGGALVPRSPPKDVRRKAAMVAGVMGGLKGDGTFGEGAN